MDKKRINELKKEVLTQLECDDDISEEHVMSVVCQVVKRAERQEGMSYRQWLEYEEAIFNSLKRLDVIERLMQDPDITEIMINGPQNIFYEKHGRIYASKETFASAEDLLEMIQQIVGAHNRRVNTLSPIVDTRLANGSRVHVVLPPISGSGPAVTIRKFQQEMMNLSTLIENGTMSEEVAFLLGQLVKEKYTIFISGGTGSGKTTLLNALSALIPETERVITIEDSKELQLKNTLNLISLEAREATIEGEGEVTIRDLIKASLRMRPDRIIVGEVRSKEAIDLVQALNTGHAGSLSTGHGNSCEDMLNRLEVMCMLGLDLPLNAIKAQIAAGIQIMVHLARSPRGERKVMEILQIDGYENGAYQCHRLFYRDYASHPIQKEGDLIKACWK